MLGALADGGRISPAAVALLALGLADLDGQLAVALADSDVGHDEHGLELGEHFVDEAELLAARLQRAPS